VEEQHRYYICENVTIYSVPSGSSLFPSVSYANAVNASM